MRAHPTERVLSLGVSRLLIWGIPISILALVFPSPKDEGLLVYALIHLALLQLLTLAFTLKIGGHVNEDWFTASRRPFLARSAALIVAAVGYSALLTLATSAAARYDVSLQFSNSFRRWT